MSHTKAVESKRNLLHPKGLPKSLNTWEPQNCFSDEVQPDLVVIVNIAFLSQVGMVSATLHSE